MGNRTVKRVPLDFDWPLKQVWKGYLTPPELVPPACRACKGTGYSPTARWLMGTFYPHQVEDGEAWGGRLLASDRAVLKKEGRDWDRHDAINRYLLTQHRCELLGAELECAECTGKAAIATPEEWALYEAWEPYEPPEGDGWQLWETTSEGSPASPVFSTARELADWCATGATWFARERATADEWLRSFEAGTTDVDSLLVVVNPAGEEGEG